MAVTKLWLLTFALVLSTPFAQNNDYTPSSSYDPYYGTGYNSVPYDNADDRQDFGQQDGAGQGVLTCFGGRIAPIAFDGNFDICIAGLLVAAVAVAGAAPALFLQVPPGWTEWANVGTCSTTCDDGLQTRTRSCTNPPPFLTTTTCDGPSSQTVPCHLADCIKVNGGWSDWTPVAGSCNAACDKTGTLSATRVCNNPAPVGKGNPCFGSATETGFGTCNGPACPPPPNFCLPNYETVFVSSSTPSDTETQFSDCKSSCATAGASCKFFYLVSAAQGGCVLVNAYTGQNGCTVPNSFVISTSTSTPSQTQAQCQGACYPTPAANPICRFPIFNTQTGLCTLVFNYGEV